MYNLSRRIQELHYTTSYQITPCTFSTALLRARSSLVHPFHRDDGTPSLDVILTHSCSRQSFYLECALYDRTPWQGRREDQLRFTLFRGHAHHSPRVKGRFPFRSLLKEGARQASLLIREGRQGIGGGEMLKSQTLTTRSNVNSQHLTHSDALEYHKKTL